MNNYCCNYNKFLKIITEPNISDNHLIKLLKYDFIYHSNKISGSNFSMDTLKMLIEKDIIVGGHYLKDVYETINSFATFDLVISSLNKDLDLDTIKNWHKCLIYGNNIHNIRHHGVFRDSLIINVTNNYQYCIETRLNLIISNFNKLKNPTIRDIVEFHLDFEKIKPFQYGSDRIGRFIFLKQLLENKLPLKYMNEKNSIEYKNIILDYSDNRIENLLKYRDNKSSTLEKYNKDKIESLLKYIYSQKDFIEENKKYIF